MGCLRVEKIEAVNHIEKNEEYIQKTQVIKAAEIFKLFKRNFFNKRKKYHIFKMLIRLSIDIIGV